MKFAIVRTNLESGQVRFFSKHFRWTMYLSSALLFDYSFLAAYYLDSYVRHSAGFCYEIRKVVE